MPVEVKKNSFYRRNMISTSGAVNLSAVFKDLPQTEANFLTLSGAANASRTVIKGAVPEDPPFGGGKLMGGYLSVTPSGTDLSQTAKLPQVAAYKVKDDTRVVEGGLKLSTNGAGGAGLMVINSIHDPSIPFIEENFDGASKSLGRVETVGAAGVGRNVFSDEYMIPDDAAKKVHAGGSYSIFHMGEDPDESDAVFLQRYFGRIIGQESGVDGGMGAVQNRVIFVRPRDRKKPNGYWKPKYDNRTGLNKYTVFMPIWKYADIKGVIRYVKRSPMPDVEPPEITTNNTIFDFLAKTPQNETLSTVDPDDSLPWSESFLQISSEVADTGGSSLEMSHIWSQTAQSVKSNRVYGFTTQVNPQYAVIGGPVIGKVPSTDMSLCYGVASSTGLAAGASQNNKTATATDTPIGDAGAGANAITPEINMRINIADMDGTISVSGGSSTNAARVSNYIFGTTSGATTTLSGLAHTYLRSFVVTLGNYKANKGETMDQYVIRGMKDAYWGGNRTSGHKIVGGIAFQRFIDDEEDHDNNVVIASPLMTRASIYPYASDSEQGLYRLISGASAVAGADANILCCPAKLDPSEEKSGAYYRITGNSTYEPCVELNMNEFFDLKFVLSLQGTELGGAPVAAVANSTWLGTDKVGGPQRTAGVRAYIKQGDVETSEKGNPIIPSLPVYFPVSGAGAGSSAWPIGDWTWGPMGGEGLLVASGNAAEVNIDPNQDLSKWPKFIYMWCQNYRHWDKADTTANKDNNGYWGTNGSTTILQDDVTDTPGSKSTKVFVDSITFNNILPQHSNNSASAAALSRPISIKQTNTYAYMGGNWGNPVTSGTLAATPDVRCIGGFNIWPNASGMELRKWFQPSYLSIGFEDGVDELNDIGGDDYDAWLGWNGFSTNNFKNLSCQDYNTVAQWYSSNSANMVTGSGDANSFLANKMGYELYSTWYGSGARGTPSGGGTRIVPNMTKGYYRNGGSTSATSPFSFVSYTGSAVFSGAGFPMGNAGFIRKGYNYLKVYGASSAGAPTADMKNNWIKRENVLTSVKMLGAPIFEKDDPLANHEGTAIRVSDTAIFDESPLGTTEYVLYKMTGGDISDADLKSPTNGLPSIESGRIYGVYQAQKRDGDIVFLDNNLLANNQVSMKATAGNDWYISPRKYWITMAFYPGNGTVYNLEDETTISSVQGLSRVGAGYSMQVGAGTAEVLTAEKYYDSINIMSGSTRPLPANVGSTYNEWTYGLNESLGVSDTVKNSKKGALYENPWVLDRGEKSETNLDLTKDYGYGTYDPETDEGGEVDIKTAYGKKQLLFDFSEIVKKNDPGPKSNFISTLSLVKATSDQGATLYGNDYATAADTPDFDLIKPHYLFEYYDELPEISGFTVGPAFDTLSAETDLYDLTTENLSGINFNWEESGDDVWYRMLFIHNAPIDNKYVNCKAWIPLNEKPEEDNGVATAPDRQAPRYYVYSPQDADGWEGAGDYTSSSIGHNVRADPTGFQGYGARMTQYVTVSGSSVAQAGSLQWANSANSMMYNLDEYLFVCHTIPMMTNASGGTIFAKGDGTSTGFELTINAAGYVVVYQSGSTLTGTTRLNRDDDIAYQIGVRFQETGTKKLILYVNGKEENSTTATVGKVGSTANWTVGFGTQIAYYDGIIEEICLYDIDKTTGDVQFVDTAGSYTYNNPYLLDKTSGSPDRTYQHYARLGLFDYHNIRGKSRTDVALSNNTTWRATGP